MNLTVLDPRSGCRITSEESLVSTASAEHTAVDVGAP
jgi:hypothetical protein